MKKTILITIAMLIGLTISAQQVVSPGAGYHSASGVQLSWTLGEPVIETFSSGSTILTQGFHQSKLSATPVTDLLIPDMDLKVFPNPTQDFVIVQIQELSTNIHCSLFDLRGKVLESRLIIDTETRINMSDYPSGVYILKFYSGNQKAIQDFRIVKSD